MPGRPGSTGGKVSNISYKTNKGYFTCTHWRQPVRVGRTEVTCSSLGYAFQRSNMEPLPDFGIYLSAIWRDKLSPFWTSGAYLKRVARLRQYPALVIDCPDMGTLKSDLLSELVEICISKMKQGKRIDIGCTAGHGRTGTLLACLIARKEHLTADEAIAQTRRRYCRHAVETRAQEDAVRKYVEELKRRLL